MIEKNNRMIPFLKLLMNHNDYMKSEEICTMLHISARTLRDDITRFQGIFIEQGLHIQSKHATGYKFVIDDEQKFHAFVEDLLKKEEEAQRVLPVYPEDRINYLLRRLLHQKGYCKLEDIADELFISRATIQNDMKEVRERLRFFHLDIESKPAYGVQIIGSEIHRRSCISQYFFHTDTMDSILTKRSDMNDEQILIRELLFETLDTMDFRLSDIGFQNLIIHISIALQRVHEQTSECLKSYEELQDTKEYQVAQVLVRTINKHFHITLAPIETYYITIHLLGKKTMQHHREYAITQEIEQLLGTIFKEIAQQYDYDFTSDFELYTVLALHFQPMLHRLRYGLSMQNPLLEDIKKEHHLAFEMSIVTASIIDEQFDCSMREEEMGYLALHYALAIERAQTKKQKKKNIIVVCASGAGSSQILLYKIRQRFQDQIHKALVIEMYKLNTIDQHAYDVILTTVPLQIATSIPVIQVQYFLGGQDIVQIRDVLKYGNRTLHNSYFTPSLFFVDMDKKTKEEVLQEMVLRAQANIRLPDNFLSSVMERENLSPTEFGNRIAMPHPMKAMCDSTFVVVAVLKRPIKWMKQQVRFVFLMCVQKDSSESLQHFHETLSTLLCDKSLMQEFEKQPDYLTLQAIWTRISSQVTSQIQDEDIFR